MSQHSSATWLQIAFAEDWLAKIWIGAIVLAAMSGLLIYLTPSFIILGFSISSIGLGLSVLLTGAIAYCLSIIAGVFFLPPIYRSRESINGAPFFKDDTVELLKKPYRGKIVKVISAGDSRYGASVSFPDDPSNSQSLNVSWHSIRRI